MYSYLFMHTPPGVSDNIQSHDKNKLNSSEERAPCLVQWVWIWRPVSSEIGPDFCVQTTGVHGKVATRTVKYNVICAHLPETNPICISPYSQFPVSNRYSCSLDNFDEIVPRRWCFGTEGSIVSFYKSWIFNSPIPKLEGTTPGRLGRTGISIAYLSVHSSGRQYHYIRLAGTAVGTVKPVLSDHHCVSKRRFRSYETDR